MHLIPTLPVATQAAPGDPPIQHGAVGSPARLALLLYLSNRPWGETVPNIAAEIGLPVPTTTHLLRLLSTIELVCCEKAGVNSKWYIPAARANMYRQARLGPQMAPSMPARQAAAQAAQHATVVTAAGAAVLAASQAIDAIKAATLAKIAGAIE